MKEINLGHVLIKYRHRRGITQDELASYMDVSKAAVSKWETGTTYPDISLLPRLAAFFNISIDELMGYEPQMTKEDIRKLYRQLTIEFSSLPIDTVLEHCREIAKKYFSCFPLLLQIGSLFVNHSMLVKDPDKTVQILEEARTIFARVKTETDDIELAKQALDMEALCLLTLGRSNEVLDLLEPMELSLTFSEPLLASAYEKIGKTETAKSILQIGMYQSIIRLFNLLPSYLNLCLDQPTTFEETYKRTIALSETFQIRTLHPGLLLSFYVSAAQNYLALGKTEKALDLLEQYTQLATSDIYPLRLHGDHYFDRLDGWLEHTLTLGSDMPRNETIVRKDMTQAVRDNPAFTIIRYTPRFQSMIRRLEANEEVAYASNYNR